MDGDKKSVPSHLVLFHDPADALAASPDDAGMDPAVQSNVLRDHLLQLVHDSLDGVSCCYGFLLVSCDGDLILRDRQQPYQ